MTETGKKQKKQNERRGWFLLKPKRNERVDFMLLILVIILTAFGFIMLFSASQNTSASDIYSTMHSQALFVLLGLAGMFLTSRIDYHVYRKISPILFAAIMAMMFVVPVWGRASHGATRWIKIGPINFQPSEICKFALVIFFADMLTKKRYCDLSKPRTLMVYGGVLLVAAAACVLQSHLSALIIIVGVGFLMLFAAGLRWRYILGLGALGAAGVGVLIAVEPYRITRIKALLDPFSDPLGDGYQIIQSLYAVGSGGLMGLGFGQSRQKYGYLPEAQNDYIYAIICEELGFFGGVAVILLFTVLIVRGIQISFSTKDAFGMYLGFGIIAIVAMQVIVNIGVVLSLFPSTGMQLPFFSSGGTSLVLMLSAMGILMNISRYSTQNKI